MQSLVTPVGYSAESCGYCKDGSTGQRTPKSRASYYISSKSMTVDVYQTLVDRGWRRSGTIFYKPDVLRHCCPHYTIRLPVASFTPAREQRQAVNRWNKHILGEKYIKEATKLYPKSKEEKAKQRNGFDLVATIHESEYTNLKRPPEPDHKFEVTLEPDDFTLEKYELLKNYQQHVHHESPSKISQDGFKRFLCSSPLERTTRTVDGKTQQLGSYHQCYRVDGRLVAMGVLDLLPHCVSGVYLLYHSGFEKWSFGKLSALREITLTLEGGYQYYYMGYYIPSCTKMRYKGQYKPSYLLDPETYDWNPLDGELQQLLDTKSYVSMARERRLRESRTGADAESSEDDLSDFLSPTAQEADKAVIEGLSLFDLKVPGLMTAEEVEQAPWFGDLTIKFKFRGRTGQVRDMQVPAQALPAWGSGSITDAASLKGFLGELVACVGPDAARDMVVEIN